jgi:hypothetical protein
MPDKIKDGDPEHLPTLRGDPELFLWNGLLSAVQLLRRGVPFCSVKLTSVAYYRSLISCTHQQSLPTCHIPVK